MESGGYREHAGSNRRPTRRRANGELLEIDGCFVGLIGAADRIRDTTAEALRLLHEDGLRIVMLTGDSRRTAEAVARKLGIDDVFAEVLPGQKSENYQEVPGRRSRRGDGRRRD